MSGSLTNYARAQLAKWAFSGDTVARPTSWKVALYTATPGADGTGGTEVSGGGYARQDISLAITGTTTAAIKNTANVEFPTATGSWGSISHAALFDDGGNMWVYGTVNDPTSGSASPQSIGSGQIFRFNTGDFETDLT
jgi:hypothetical protein